MGKSKRSRREESGSPSSTSRSRKKKHHRRYSRSPSDEKRTRRRSDWRRSRSDRDKSYSGHRDRDRDQHSGDEPRSRKGYLSPERSPTRYRSTSSERSDPHSSRRRKSHERNRSKRIYDFEVHKPKLVKIFFRETDLIPHGSNEYKDPVFPSEMNPKLKYDKLLCRSFALLPDDPKDLLNRIPFQDSDYDAILTLDMVKEFQKILNLFVDFLQKEKLNKLKKLREGQANLPIAEFRNEILEKIAENRVVIVAGDTGCGKSTQLPQYLLQAGYDKIACTQPRRIACIALANRVSFETLNEFGKEIGYQIRFEKNKSDKTRVLFLTEGLLLRQISADSGLSGYNVIVLDEVHERHITTDFLLGAVKCLIQVRDDIKVILMSATINIKLFQDYFNGDAPVVQVPGRLYPITVNFFPIPTVEQSSSEKLNPAPYVRILQLIDNKYPETERGDVLIFMSGIKEITTIVDACKEYAEKNQKWIVLALHSTLSLADQDKVFDYPPENVRKCIVSTNIAETSITIDGVRFVVDSGKVKEMQYDPVCKMRRLKEFWISRASAEQRKGRAGRTGPGVCYRLFSESDYKALSPYSTPEIQRVPLDGLVLQMVSMGLPDVRKFPFLEAPPPEAIENSILVLKEQDAMGDDETLTSIGKMLANLPVDVTVGKMLIMGTLFHQVDSVLTLAAALSVQSPFTNNAFKDQDCIAARRNLDSDHGDPITLLNAYREWLEAKASSMDSNSRKWCKQRGLEEQRFYEMTKLRNQFEELLGQSGLLDATFRSDDFSSKDMSSVERAARHGQLKQLREMKKEYQKKEGQKKKKVLKMQNGFSEQNEDEDDSLDIKDIEFRMKTDNRKMKSLLQSSKAVSYKDLNILKIIICSGLYPQLALGDEFNHAKSGSEQLYHTKVKPFNLIHPNSIFAANPEILNVDEMDIVDHPGFNRKYPVSSKHQLLIYLSLLETNKPYLMTTLRMPALQTLLLFAHTIDTNASLSRLVFDQWIEIRFPDVTKSQNQLYLVSRLRSWWHELLSLRLDTSVHDPVASKEKQVVLEAQLSRGLVDFIHTETFYSIKRLLPGDLKILYSGPGSGLISIDRNPFSTEFEPRPNETRGGLRLTEYLTYNCIDDPDDLIRLEWICEFCDEKSYSGVMDRICHFADCFVSRDEKVADEEKANFSAKVNPLAKAFDCSSCGKTLHLTTTEILRHRKTCKKD